MPALANEPFRGLSVLRLTDAGGTRAYSLSIDTVNPLTDAADQTSWKGASGSSFVIRFQWQTSGAPTFSQADTILIQAMAPGGSSLGAWSPGISGDSGLATRTFHFDDNPASGTFGTSREGMLELRLTVSRAAAVAWGTINSAGSGTAPAGATASWGRGKFRADTVLSSFLLSNVSLGGAEPATFLATMPTFNRVTMDADWYRIGVLLLKHRQAGSDVRSSAADTTPATTLQRDYSWNASATGAGNKGRINKDYAAASTLTTIRLVLPSTAFGTDPEYAWATTGHPTGWTRIDDATLEYTDRFTADPRVDFSHLLSIGSNTWATPPLSADQADGKRLNADLAFLASRAKDMGGTGLNGLAWTGKLWDNSQLVGTEASPVKSNTVSASATQGGQAGWSNGATIPITWDNSLPSGSWTHKAVLTTTDLTGLEVNNSRTVTLLAADPRVRLHMQGGDPTTPQDHWFPGKSLTIGIGLVKAGVLQSADAGTAKIALLRFDSATGRVQYLDPTDSALNTWTYVPLSGGSNGVIGYFTASTTPAVSASPGDGRLFLLSFTGAQTGGSNWNSEDIIVTALMDLGGVTYNEFVPLVATGTKWKHGSTAAEADIVFDTVTGHHHVGTDSRAIGER